jgi:hypothetical protein
MFFLFCVCLAKIVAKLLIALKKTTTHTVKPKPDMQRHTKLAYTHVLQLGHGRLFQKHFAIAIQRKAGRQLLEAKKNIASKHNEQDTQLHL